MMHVGAYHESIDGGGTLQARTAVADQILDIAGDNMRVPRELPYLAAVYVGTTATTVSRAVITSPSLQGRQLVEVQPISATPEPGVPAAMMAMYDHPVRLEPGEVCQLQLDTDNAGAVDEVGVVWWTSGPIAYVAPPANCIWARFVTAASALTAFGWSLRALTPDRNLPDGSYDVYGMRAQTSSGIAARLAFPGQSWRPGCLINDAATDAHSYEQWISTHLGKYGTFRSDNLPQIDLFATAADNEVQEVDLLLRRVG